MKTLKVLLLAMLIMAIASPAKACECEPCIKVTKTVEPEVSKVGDVVVYTICIENCGPTTVFYDGGNIIDDLLGDLSEAFGFSEECGENMGIIEPGFQCCLDFPYEIQPGDDTGEEGATLVNTVTFTAIEDECGTVPEPAQASATVNLVHPNFTVEKICPPISKVGDEVCYTVIITNTGDTPLEILSVEDSLCDLNGCVGVILSPGEERVDECCLLVPPDAPDPLENTVTVVAQVVGLPNILERESEPCETDLVEPDIDLQKTVDDPNACPGETVIYTICIENTGDWPLENVVVTDPDLGGILPEFPPVLFPGEIFCADFPYVVPPDAPCPLVNCAEVTANPSDLPNVIDANDCAEICCEPPGDEGCTPGFWKNNGDKQGASAWGCGLTPDMPISHIFMLNEPLVIRGNGKSTVTDPTLLQALDANGGGVNAMIRHGVAALLNACSPCVSYPINDPLKIVFMIEDTLNGVPGAYSVDELHTLFAGYNEAGCPVNQNGECVGVEESD